LPSRSSSFARSITVCSVQIRYFPCRHLRPRWFRPPCHRRPSPHTYIERGCPAPGRGYVFRVSLFALRTPSMRIVASSLGPIDPVTLSSACSREALPVILPAAVGDRDLPSSGNIGRWSCRREPEQQQNTQQRNSCRHRFSSRPRPGVLPCPLPRDAQPRASAASPERSGGQVGWMLCWAASG